MSELWYDEVPASQRISQGDIFPNMHVYSVQPEKVLERDDSPIVNHFVATVIVLTQACDLENDPVQSVVVATLDPIKDMSWKFVSSVLAGRRPAYHILHEYHSDNVMFQYHMINFSDLYTIPYTVLDEARKLYPYRLRLKSPYLEHTAQRFGAYFSRIGLPKGINEAHIKAHLRDE